MNKTERPSVAEMKRLLFAGIAELRELEGRYRETLLPPTMTYAHARYDVCRIAQRTFRASLDAHEAFLSQSCRNCLDSGKAIPRRGLTEVSCWCNRPAQIQALYEALCGGEK